MKVGDSATLTRTYGPGDLEGYGRLAELAGPVPETVPEPLIGGLFSYLLGADLPGFGTNYLKQQMNFRAPARVGEALTATATITRLRPDKHLVDLATVCRTGDGRIICDGHALVLVRDVGTPLRDNEENNQQGG